VKKERREPDGTEAEKKEVKELSREVKTPWGIVMGR